MAFYVMNSILLTKLIQSCLALDKVLWLSYSAIQPDLYFTQRYKFSL